MSDKHKNESIVYKIKRGTLVLATLTASAGVMGVSFLYLNSFRYEKLYERFGVGTANVYAISSDVLDIKDHIQGLMARVGTPSYSGIKTNMKNLKENIDVNFNGYEKVAEYKKRNSQSAELETNLDKFFSLSDKLAGYLDVNQIDKAEKLFDGEFNDVANKLLEDLRAEKIFFDAEGAEEFTRTRSRAVMSGFVLLAIATVAGVFGLLIQRKLVESVSSPIKNLVGISERMASGDLSVDFKVYANDELGKLAKTLNAMVRNLNVIMRDIQKASVQVSLGSKEMANSSQVLSEGATEQASAVEQLTASVEEISAQTEKNAQSALKAKDFMVITKQGAVDGNAQMNKMVSATEDIRKSSVDINNIIKVIDEIAFQTNILALNAAVEAARAGQHGKGFAVVADEVRNLAVRSANAVKETTELINNSIEKTNVGAELAISTAESLQKIVKNVSEVAELVGDIANASKEQSLGIQHINIGITQVSDVVQTTSATAEQTASSSMDLAGQAEAMNGNVNKFKLSRSANTTQLDNEDEGELANAFAVIDDIVKNGLTDNNFEISFDDGDFGRYSKN